LRESLNQSRQREKDFTNLEKNGLMARNDLLKAQLQTANIELNLLDAENNLQLANVTLDLILGLPASTELSLDTTGINRKNDPRVLDDFLKAALQNRKDRQAMNYRKKSLETGVLSVKAEKYPALQLTGGYVAIDVPHVLSVVNAMNLGLGVSWSVSSLWKNKSKMQQAQARVKQIQISLCWMTRSRCRLIKIISAWSVSGKKLTSRPPPSNRQKRIIKLSRINSTTASPPLLNYWKQM